MSAELAVLYEVEINSIAAIEAALEDAWRTAAETQIIKVELASVYEAETESIATAEVALEES